jgi:hypothetical protein
MLPPKTTAVTVPISFVKARFQKRNSFEEPTNIEFTAETLPRMWSGVLSCKMV